VGDDVGLMVESTTINRAALLVAIALAAGIAWFAIQDREPLLLVLALGLLLVGPLVRHVDHAPATFAAPQAPARPVTQTAAGASPPSDAIAAVPGMSPAVYEQLVKGDKIGAIKQYRTETGLGLREAKDGVEAFERQLTGHP
jgi:ribosomal protein L7/L12